jgi:hypothetical protein
MAGESLLSLERSEGLLGLLIQLTRFYARASMDPLFIENIFSFSLWANV